MIRSLIAWLFLVIGVSPIAAQNFEIDITQFDRWIFSGMENPEVARLRLASHAQMEIDRIAVVTPLQESQIKKLEFAAKGDVKRFFDKVDDAHRQFHAMREAGEIGQANINELYQIASPLAQHLNRGIYDDDSLLKKVARGCVDDEQAKLLREQDQRQQKLESDAAIMVFLAKLGRQVPMTHFQRQALSELMTENILLREPRHNYASYVLMYQMSKLPQAKLKSIFDDAQYDAVKKNFQPGIMMKANFKQMGLLDDE